MKNLSVNFFLFLITVTFLSSCNKSSGDVSPEENVVLSNESIAELKSLKESLGSNMAYEIKLLENIETGAKARVLYVAQSEEFLKQSNSDYTINFKVNLKESELKGNLDEVTGRSNKSTDNETSEAKIYLIVDEIITDTKLVSYGFEFIANDSNNTKNLRGVTGWAYTFDTKSDKGATSGNAYRLPSNNINNSIVAKFYTTNCWICGYNYILQHSYVGDYETYGYYDNNVHKHKVEVKHNWSNFGIYFTY